MLPLKSYRSTFGKAGSAGTSLLGPKQKRYIQNLSFLKELNKELGDLTPEFQWTSSSVLTKMGGKKTTHMRGCDKFLLKSKQQRLAGKISLNHCCIPKVLLLWDNCDGVLIQR